MTLNITTSWEHDTFAATEGSSHLVVTISASESAAGERAPIDLAFALDRSGSMGGERKLELAKQAVLAAVQQLKPTDRVSLVTYDHEVQVLHRLTPVDAAHRARLERVTRGIEVGGMTNLSGGWLEACRQLSGDDSDATRVRRALLLTDGLANVGIIEPRELNTHARELRDRGISTSAIGVGEGFDEILLSSMVESGGGNFQYIAHAAELEAFFSDELRSLADMVALSPYLDLTMPHGVTAELINAFPTETHRRHTSVDVRDLAAGEQVHLVFAVTSRRVRGESIVPELHLHWTNPRTSTVEEINQEGAPIAVGDTSNAQRDDAATEKVALEMAARDHREAVKLDREGRFRESRDRFFQSAARLEAAPDTEEVRGVRSRTRQLYSMDASMAMPEHDRKTAIHDAHRRSRGGRRPDGEPGQGERSPR
jgi:Ca-activated chloride channel family protein